MGDKSAIEWTDATWNPVTGCTKVSQGCAHCYAERQFPRVYGTERKFTDVRCHEDRLDQPLRWSRPRKIFVNSMSDLFHPDVPFEFIKAVFDVISAANWHTFQILTKRPERMLQFAQWLAGQDDISIACWPRNAWLGVSVEDQSTTDKRIPLLLQTPAAVRFVSAEPLLGPVVMEPLWLRPSPSTAFLSGKVTWEMPAYTRIGCVGLDWVIVGGESGPKARPLHPDWVRSIRDQCAQAGVPFLFKQWGEWWPISRTDGIHDLPFGKYNTDTRFGFSKIGKREAGRLLDGTEYNGYPQQ